MKVDHRLLYWGVFFIAAGAVLLVGLSATVTDEEVARALALWPVLVIALGVGLLLRRTRFGVAGGMLAAAVPGLLIGGVVVAAPHAPSIGVDCGQIRPAAIASRDGTFVGVATVELRLSCGDLTVTTAPGTGWHLTNGAGLDRPATIDASVDRLTITSPVRTYGFGRSWEADDWQLALPTANRLDLEASVTAGHGRFDLAGARVGTLRLDVNAAEAQVDLTEAIVERLSIDANAAKVSLELPSTGDLAADVDVNAGSLEICVPAGTAMRIHEQGVLAGTTWNGLVRNGDAWESPDYATAIHHADVTVTANVASVVASPEGGCK